ncbi:hypothetical protein BSL78_25217 [Apostichopus japonicus]|uniref:Male-enhanced antigen 1 n=1 Tax=Stichopus japonicus TaxID=307972 RepID=A0A2G8JQA7_STIJA|nr:hypothetical protein BSL78_25217 [Apostichopus japonicus]
MSPFTEGDIPMDGDDEDDLPPLPNGVINVEVEDSDDDEFSDGSEGDGEETGHTGYQLLSQDVESEIPPEDIEHSHDESNPSHVDLPSHLANLMPSQSVEPDPAACVSYRDTQSEQESRKRGMAADEQIKLAMTGLHYPFNAPSWVTTLDEDEWKKILQRSMKEHTRTDGDKGKDINPNR